MLGVLIIRLCVLNYEKSCPMRIIYPWAIGFCWENSFWVGFELFGCVFYHMQKVDICGPRRILASSYGALLAILVDVSNRVKSHTKNQGKRTTGALMVPD